MNPTLDALEDVCSDNLSFRQAYYTPVTTPDSSPSPQSTRVDGIDSGRHVMRWCRMAPHIFLLLIVGCEENLPPRIDPRTIDPSTFLEVSLSATDGPVVFIRGDTFTSSYVGVFTIEARNLHDEVLQAREDIQMDVDYWLYILPNEVKHIHGENDALINTYNHAGGHFMLEDGLLTIEPDSVARFEISIPHLHDQLWLHAGTPTFDTSNGILRYPPITVSGKGTIKLFEDYPAIYAGEVQLEVEYVWHGYTRLFLIDSSWVGIDSDGNVVVQWRTFLGRGELVGFNVEKSMRNVDEDYYMIGDLVPDTNVLDKPSYYSFTDLSTESGVWFYRIVQVETFPGVGFVETGYTIGMRIVVP